MNDRRSRLRGLRALTPLARPKMPKDLRKTGPGMDLKDKLDKPGQPCPKCAASLRRAETSYQGWTNRATWSVSLWLNNEEGMYNHMRAITMGEGEDYEKGDELQEFVEALVGVGSLEGLAADLLGIALEQVNWREIVEKNQEE